MHELMTLYVHGSQARPHAENCWERQLTWCLTVTLVMVCTGAFRLSSLDELSFRGVFGQASVVDEGEEKLAALRSLSEHMIPGRWDEVRGPNEQELKATSVLSLPLAEASAKVRTGPPIDDEEDYALSVWAGVIPLRLIAEAPLADPRLPQDIAPPDYLIKYERG